MKNKWLSFNHSEIRSRDINQFIVAGLLVVIMGLPGTVVAQDDDTEGDFVIEEVVVTAQRREQNPGNW